MAKFLVAFIVALAVVACMAFPAEEQQKQGDLQTANSFGLGYGLGGLGGLGLYGGGLGLGGLGGYGGYGLYGLYGR